MKKFAPMLAAVVLVGVVALTAVANPTSQSQEPAKTGIHPAFDPGPAVLDQLWKKGFSEAAKKKDDHWIFDKLKRGIGKVRTNVWGQTETVSWFWLWLPEALIYREGFSAKKQYWPDEEVAASKRLLEDPEFAHPTDIAVSGLLSIQPSFGGSGSSIDRSANPADLKGVRVVLAVGDKVYQPIAQPGDLPFVADTGSYTRTSQRSSTSTTNVNGSVGGSEVALKGRTTNYYTEVISGNYRYYEAHFDARFLLFEKDGTPRIPADTKEVSFIVIYGPNERRATYKLSDLLSIRK